MPVPLRVLVVDDDSATRRCVETLLRHAGYSVAGANSCESALMLADHHHFDVAVCDIGLPGRDGWDLIRDLRQQHHIPGIAVSGYGMSEDVTASEAAGFCTHLVKPVDFEDLHAAIELAARLVPPQRDRGIPYARGVGDKS